MERDTALVQAGGLYTLETLVSIRRFLSEGLVLCPIGSLGELSGGFPVICGRGSSISQMQGQSRGKILYFRTRREPYALSI